MNPEESTAAVEVAAHPAGATASGEPTLTLLARHRAAGIQQIVREIVYSASGGKASRVINFAQIVGSAVVKKQAITETEAGDAIRSLRGCGDFLNERGLDGALSRQGIRKIER